MKKTVTFIANPPRIAQTLAARASNDIASTASPSLSLPTLHKHGQLTQGQSPRAHSTPVRRPRCFAHQSSPSCSPGPGLALLPPRGASTQAAETETGDQWKIGKCRYAPPLAGKPSEGLPSYASNFPKLNKASAHREPELEMFHMGEDKFFLLVWKHFLFISHLLQLRNVPAGWHRSLTQEITASFS